MLLGAECYVVDELDKLIDSTLNVGDLRQLSQRLPDLKGKALALIDSAERLTALRSDNSISADLRRSIDTSVKESYFSNSPVKAMLTAAAALLAILFGGTVYSTFKVDGVMREAEQATLRITDKVAAFDKQADDINQRLQLRIDEAVRAAAENKIKELDAIVASVSTAAENKIKELDAIVAPVRAAAENKIKELDAIVAQAKEAIDQTVKSTSGAIETEKNKQIKVFMDSVSPAVENTKRLLEEYLQRAPVDVQKTIAASQTTAIQAIEADQAEARKVLDSRRANAVTAIDGAEKAATAAIMSYQAAVNSARSTAETEMSKATGAINNLQKNTQTSIDAAKDEVEARGKAAADQIDKIVATIPERVRKTGDSVVALNDLLAKYEAPVAEVIARLQANKPQSTLDAIAAVLGSSVLLMAIALGLSVLALVLSIVAMLRRTVPRGAAKLP